MLRERLGPWPGSVRAVETGTKLAPHFIPRLGPWPGSVRAVEPVEAAVPSSGRSRVWMLRERLGPWRGSVRQVGLVEVLDVAGAAVAGIGEGGGAGRGGGAVVGPVEGRGPMFQKRRFSEHGGSAGS